MSISFISISDMEFPHFEGNHKTQDGRGSPKSQRSGSPFSIVEDVVAGFASPISTTSPQNVGKDKKPAIPSIALDSFLPLLKALPALVLDGNTYHLRGAISKSDLQNLSAYVQTIGEFTLNSNSSGDGQHSIAPGALMRLAQLKIRDAPGPLLPSLKQFRVIEPNESSISQLSLFFTKSLRSLEATGVPEAQQSAFLSFLITLVDEAPLLSAITLGPGSFTTTCLNACLNFDHLSHIEFLDAASSIDFDFLVAIGGLPELETFILHARTATYIPPRVPSPIPQFPARPCEPIDIQSRSDNPNAAATVNRFSRLRRLDIIGSLPLIRHLYEHIIAVDLEKLGMTLVRTSSPTSHVLPEDEPPTINDIDLETDSFFTLVENAVEEKWPLTLKDVRLGHLQDYVSEFYGGWGYVSSDPDPIALPFMTFGMLLKHEILENLEIAGWTLPYNSEKQCLVDEILQAALPELKTMHLPIGAPTPGIQLDQLLPMVRAFPKLMSLQCGFEQPGTCPIPPNLAADVPLHGLKVLSVGHQNSDIDQKQQLRIASVLDILFPNLERIETHTGYHAEVWAYIYELIKMCQASRLNHANRLSVSCGP